MQFLDEYPNLFVVNHPLVQHKLSIMRDKNTKNIQFRNLLKEITYLIGGEATKNLQLTYRTIETPMTSFENAPTLLYEKPFIVPILRAGLFMAEGMLSLLPCAKIGHIGMYRDAKTRLPIEYFVKLPTYNGEPVFLVDPMFATGNTAIDAVKVLIKRGIPRENIVFISLLGVENAVKNFTSHFPDIPIYIGDIDKELNGDAYIIPGLGDAGDRLFGTED